MEESNKCVWALGENKRFFEKSWAFRNTRRESPAPLEVRTSLLGNSQGEGGCLNLCCPCPIPTGEQKRDWLKRHFLPAPLALGTAAALRASILTLLSGPTQSNAAPPAQPDSVPTGGALLTSRWASLEILLV